MPLDKTEKLERLNQRSVPAERPPIESVVLEPLPREVVQAFPSLVEWHKKSNARLAEFVARMNTVVPR